MADTPIPTHVITRTLVFNHQGQVLLLVRSGDDLHRPRGIDIPGGKVDDGEDYVAAAIRETEEETGIILDRQALHVFCAATEIGFSNRLQRDVNYVCLGFISQVDDDTAVKLSYEHTAFEWRSLDEAIAVSKGITQGKFMDYLKTHELFSAYWQAGA